MSMTATVHGIQSGSGPLAAGGSPDSPGPPCITANTHKSPSAWQRRCSMTTILHKQAPSESSSCPPAACCRKCRGWSCGCQAAPCTPAPLPQPAFCGATSPRPLASCPSRAGSRCAARSCACGLAGNRRWATSPWPSAPMPVHLGSDTCCRYLMPVHSYTQGSGLWPCCGCDDWSWGIKTMAAQRETRVQRPTIIA